MAEKRAIYRCNICGNIVDVLDSGAGQMMCCGEPMELLVPKTLTDEGMEKHVPRIEKTKAGYIVKVGSAPHPMLEEHYIEWIELMTDKDSYRHFLQPGEKPESTFEIDARQASARIYCNIHGLWIS